MTNLTEKFRLNFSRCTNRDVAPLRENEKCLKPVLPVVVVSISKRGRCSIHVDILI